MKVKLISHSQPTSSTSFDYGWRTLEDVVAYSARVSNPSNQNNSETSSKLLQYLVKHGHWSPFEMASICLEIETTRDIARQILRHRSFSFQEFSQRYADPTKELGFVTREARLQDLKNRQNSIEMADDNEVINEFYSVQAKVLRASRDAYDWAIRNCIAKEQARSVLPEGLTESRMYMNGTVRSWMHYIDLRSAHGTQKEHMEIARACGEAIKPIFPMIEDFVHD